MGPTPKRDLIPESVRSFLAKHDAPCPKCRYNLRGVKTEACPECGWVIDASVVRPLMAVTREPLVLDEEMRTRLAGRDFPCPKCGCSWRGLERAGCPECGLPFGLTELQDILRAPARERWGLAGAILGTLACAGWTVLVFLLPDPFFALYLFVPGVGGALIVATLLNWRELRRLDPLRRNRHATRHGALLWLIGVLWTAPLLAIVFKML